MQMPRCPLFFSAAFLQATISGLLYINFLAVYYLVAFDDITWKLSKHDFIISARQCRLNAPNFGQTISLYSYHDNEEPFARS